MIGPAATPPAWVRDAVGYQIFVDRFANADPSLDPVNVLPWGAPPSAAGFMGGDLLGIRQRLDYLEDLGVNLLCLTPVFMAASNHRYDVYDYYRVDPRLGTSDDLARLLAEAHQRGMRVLLDGVFNHCGRGFYPFFDVMENGPASAWSGWFTVRDYPLDAYGAARYVAWRGVAALPEFNLAHAPVRDYLLRVAEYWTGKGIDGWRLDAVPHVGHREFWQELRDAVERVNPDAYLLAEIWGDAEPWLEAGYFHGATHYAFREAVLKFVMRQSMRPSEFAGRLSVLFRRPSWATTLGMWNLLGSHDTPRLASSAQGALDRVRMALLLLFFCPGVPSLYYGDEVGLEGGKDPDNRRAMEWDESRWNGPLRDFVRRLITVRRRWRPLREGHWHTLLTDDANEVCAFGRSCGPEHAILVLHPGANATGTCVPLGSLCAAGTSSWEDAVSQETIVAEGDLLRLDLPPRSGRLLTATIRDAGTHP